MQRRALRVVREGERLLAAVSLLEQDDDMKNNYSVIAVNDAAPFKDADGKAVSGVAINTVGAKALIDWLMSDAASVLIADYGVAEYGEALFTLADGKPVSTAQIPQATDATKTIRLSTTTSVNDSGLLAYLLPMFETKYGYTVEVTAAGTGKAIAAATMGNVYASLGYRVVTLPKVSIAERVDFVRRVIVS